MELEYDEKEFVNYIKHKKKDGLILGVHPPNLVTPRHTYFIEITFNYPRTPLFLKMTSEYQKKLYSKLWHKVVDRFKISTEHFYSDYVYECCKSGQLHCHGFVRFDIGNMHFPLVILSDMAKTYLNLLPKKYDKFHEANMYSQYIRYRCPSICLQLRSSHDDNFHERVNLWFEYIQKCQHDEDIKKCVRQGKA